LIVLISSNRGRAGAFNTNAIKMARQLIDGPYAKQFQAGNVQFITIGKKATDYVIKNNLKLISSHNELFDQLSFEHVAPVAIRIMEGFLNKEFDKVEVLYNGFKNAAVQLPTIEQFLPVEKLETAGNVKAKSVDYLFEPNQKTIVEELIPKSLKIQLYKAILDSNAAEHGARMTAMNKATENAKDLIKELKLSYNKARQAAITNEILEIVGGAEALNG
jgi:F-type H+-transporting ATPase subunit gamma